MTEQLNRELPDYVRLWIIELCKETELRDYVSFNMEYLADKILLHFGVKKDETT